MLRAALLFACSLLLAGCYESQDLLLNADAPSQPLRAGDYKITNEEGEVSAVHVTPRSDGWYDISETEDGEDSGTHRVLLNALDKDGARALYAYAAYDSDEAAYIYGLIAIDAQGQVTKKDSDCHRDADAKIAVEKGGTKLVDSCQFYRNDKALLAALTALAQNPKHWDRID